jgi:hypothetical protein
MCGKHRAGQLYRTHRTLKQFKADLRIGFYGGGDLNNFVGMEQWTATAANCLDIKDMRNIDTIETDDLKLEDAGSESDYDFNPADGAE